MLAPPFTSTSTGGSSHLNTEGGGTAAPHAHCRPRLRTARRGYSHTRRTHACSAAQLIDEEDGPSCTRRAAALTALLASAACLQRPLPACAADVQVRCSVERKRLSAHPTSQRTPASAQRHPAGSALLAARPIGAARPAGPRCSVLFPQRGRRAVCGRPPSASDHQGGAWTVRGARGCVCWCVCGCVCCAKRLCGLLGCLCFNEPACDPLEA